MNAAVEQAPGLTARLVGREAFAGLRSAWTRLADALPDATPFASWEWTDAWLDTIGRDVEARFVVLEDAGGIRGILPLARSLSAAGLPGARLLTTCGVDAVYPDQLEPLVGVEDLPALIDALDIVWTDAPRWDCVRIRMVAEDAPVCVDLERRARAPQRAARIERREVTNAPFLKISSDFETYLKSLSSNERYKIRSRTRKLLAGRGAEYSDLGSMSSSDALGLLRVLHAKRASQKGIASTFDTEPVQRFHERLLRAMPPERVLWRCLRSGGEIFAMFYGFRVAQRLFYFQLGYDPAWSEFSAGLVLLSETIREAFDSGCREYNFLQGDEPFKSTWTRATRRLYDWTLYRPGLRGELMYRWSRMRQAARSRMVQFAAARRGASEPRDERGRGS